MNSLDEQSTSPTPEESKSESSAEGYGLEPAPESAPEATREPSADSVSTASGSAEPDALVAATDATSSPTPFESEETYVAAVPLLVDGPWKPWAVAASVVLGIVVIMILAGWSSLFPQQDGRFLDASGRPVLDAPEIADRFSVVIRMFLTACFMVASAILAFHITAFFETRPVGDRASGAARLGLGVALAAAVRLIPVGGGLLQVWLHLGLGLLVLIATAFLLLRLRGPSLTLLFTSWGIAYVLAGLAARLLTWGVPLF